MNHPDIETLAQLALDDPLALDASTLVHISDCEECSAEISQIQRVVDATLVIGGRPDLRTQTSPPPQVWERIIESLDEGGTTNASTPAGLHRGESIEQGWLFGTPDLVDDTQPAETYLEPPARPTTAWRLLAAAVVGVILGAGVTWVVTSGPDNPTGSSNGNTAATSTLEGIDGHTENGRLKLKDTSQGQRLTVDFDPGATGNKFVQVWLLDAQTGGMVPLGVLDGTSGTYAVPPGIDLARYSQVDVSLEPFDGNPLHSKTSLARGPVPSS